MNISRDDLAQCGERLRRDLFAARFVASAGGILLVTGLAKVISAIGHARVLDAPDPLFGIPLRLVLLLVGQAELFIAFFCLFTKLRNFSLLAVAWVSSNFLVYRLGLWFIDWHQPCGCLGNLTDLLHISPRLADNTMKVMRVAPVSLRNGKKPHRGGFSAVPRGRAQETGWERKLISQPLPAAAMAW